VIGWSFRLPKLGQNAGYRTVETLKHGYAVRALWSTLSSTGSEAKGGSWHIVCQRTPCQTIVSQTLLSHRFLRGRLDKLQMKSGSVETGPEVFWSCIKVLKRTRRINLFWALAAFFQGGPRIKMEYLGSNFLVKPSGLDLPTYVIRHISIYGNMTSSPWSFWSSTVADKQSQLIWWSWYGDPAQPSIILFIAETWRLGPNASISTSRFFKIDEMRQCTPKNIGRTFKWTLKSWKIAQSTPFLILHLILEFGKILMSRSHRKKRFYTT